MGKVLPFLQATNELLTERGVELPLPGQVSTTTDDRAERGLAVQKQIAGDDPVEAMYADASADTLHLQRLLSANCLGDHLTRSGLDLATRELLTFAVLTALGGADAQVAGHVHVGNTRADPLCVVTALLPYFGYPRTLNALAAVNAHDVDDVDRSVSAVSIAAASTGRAGCVVHSRICAADSGT